VFARKVIPVYAIPTPRPGARSDTVIGQTRTYRIRPGDTLFDVARYHDLGFNEIADANPGVDAWVPKVGTTIVLPTAWVLPCCTYQGLVVNIPEMRLYLYRPKPGDPSGTVVHTYPVGLGRADRRTPRGTFTVRGKTVNPRWNIPESIRREHIAERGDARTFIAGGAADNPLGRYRIELSVPLYSIHGTDVPWGVGMQVSHGCVRLYPEDIERAFPLVDAGMPVKFVYQPVKVGRRGRDTFFEAHADIYRLERSLWQSARAAFARQGLGGRIDRARLGSILDRPLGLPVRVPARTAAAS
jgi:L,D-transpeptidase ErfK/SrfK